MKMLGQVVAAGLILAATGCGSKTPGTVKVSGKVLHGGKPVVRATVSFMPVASEGRTASGLTNESGEYQLTTFTANDGAVPGSYMITVNPMPKRSTGAKAAATNTMTTPEDYAKAMAQGVDPTTAGMASEEETDVPPAYRSPDTTPLKKDVSAQGPNQFDLLVD